MTARKDPMLKVSFIIFSLNFCERFLFIDFKQFNAMTYFYIVCNFVLCIKKSIIFTELKTWPLFSNIEWENILQMKAPFVPVPDSQTDTTYFEGNLKTLCPKLCLKFLIDF